MIVQTLALAVGLVVWGAHPLAGWRLDLAAWRRAATWALPVAAVAAILMLRATVDQADAAVAVGFGPGWPISVEGRMAFLLVLAALAGDALALGFRGRDDPQARRLSAVLGFAGLVGFAIWAELLRLGEGPDTTVTTFWFGAAARVVVGLGAGELMLPGRLRLAAASALALLLYPFCLPNSVAAALEANAGWLTLFAGAALFLLARFLDQRAARLALLAAVLLSALFFARAAELSQALRDPMPTIIETAPGA